MWVKLDDSINTNRKIQAAGTAAGMLYAMALAYANRNSTGGIIDRNVLRQVWCPVGERFNYRRAADALVREGLWVDEGDCWRIHDYFDFQPSAETVERRRAADAERQARKRARDKAAREALASHRDRVTLAKTKSRRDDAAKSQGKMAHGAAHCPASAKGERADNAGSMQSSGNYRADIAQSQNAQVLENTRFTSECHGVTHAPPDPDPDPKEVIPREIETESMGAPQRVVSLSLVPGQGQPQPPNADLHMNAVGLRRYLLDRMGDVGKVNPEVWVTRLVAEAAKGPFSRTEVDAAIDAALEKNKFSGGFVCHVLLAARAKQTMAPMRSNGQRPAQKSWFLRNMELGHELAKRISLEDGR